MNGIKGIAARCAIFGSVGAVLLLLLYNTMIDPVDGDMSTYRAEFVEVSGLRVGDDVRIAGVKVGNVEEVSIDGDQAVVTFSISQDHPLTKTSGLVLRYQNLIGQRYLAVVPGAEDAELLDDDAMIPLSRTSAGFDLTALLNGFRPLFAVLEPADINALSESVVKVLQGEGGTVTQLLEQTTELTNYLADREDLFQQVAVNLTPLLEEISGNGDQLQSTVHRLAQLTTGLARQRHTTGKSIDQLSELVGRTNALVTQIRSPLARDIAALRKVVRMYAANNPRYAESFARFGAVLETLGRTTSYRSALNQLMCEVTLRSGDAEVLVGTPGDRHSEVCR